MPVRLRTLLWLVRRHRTSKGDGVQGIGSRYLSSSGIRWWCKNIENRLEFVSPFCFGSLSTPPSRTFSTVPLLNPLSSVSSLVHKAMTCPMIPCLFFPSRAAVWLPGVWTLDIYRRAFPCTRPMQTVVFRI